MSEHYFSHKPQSKSSPKTWNYTLRGKNFIFTSDVGVFSKNEVDFGSRLLIEEFRLPTTTGDILDMGCGYGPIGIALASDFADRNIVMADVNERALQLAEKNAKNNDVKNTEFIISDRFTNLENRTFAAIVTNPPIRAGKKVVHEIFQDSRAALHNGGELWVVIQKKQGAPSAKAKLEELFEEVKTVARDKGYIILRAINV
ncbi:class I SAM-dependent methyltransferase [Ornithinibacillus halophilus]|uniref:16S rRNA m(2)G 1207 methyltransferase n=1 Tax=Ornithinibacillus halophilus TaxID=930117 RepID=A0A1M5H976_9BACI|nr:class I SAM-dependent methyltransferase [Ornithinibacillus halophilus]SHG12494.1 16S rRNA m(2)G 1207 methyltransferase [Ornithinibacillus halophilus]